MPDNTLAASEGFKNIAAILACVCGGGSNAVPSYRLTGNRVLMFLLILSGRSLPGGVSLTGVARAADVTTHVFGAKKQALSYTTDTVKAGYYAAAKLSVVDTDLAAGNIRAGTAIFGATGTYSGNNLPDTGQTASYTATWGEDHDYNPAATQPSFTDNSDYTITDNRTGLMWKKCSEGLNNDNACSGTIGTYLWEDAITRCEGLTAPVYSDWRLPNVRELESIVDYQHWNPSIDTTFFPATSLNVYFTSTIFVSDTYYPWSVDFLEGGAIIYDAREFSYPIRCVRGGP